MSACFAIFLPPLKLVFASAEASSALLLLPPFPADTLGALQGVLVFTLVSTLGSSLTSLVSTISVEPSSKVSVLTSSTFFPNAPATKSPTVPVSAFPLVTTFSSSFVLIVPNFAIFNSSLKFYFTSRLLI